MRGEKERERGGERERERDRETLHGSASSAEHWMKTPVKEVFENELLNETFGLTILQKQPVFSGSIP